MAIDMTSSKLGEYRDVQAHGSLSDASPHAVIQVMLQTVIDRLSQARGCVERADLAGKSAAIGKALVLVEALQLNLDIERGGDLAANLNNLYDYMTRTLLQANAGNSPELLDEVVGLLGEIKSGWDGIANVD